MKIKKYNVFVICLMALYILTAHSHQKGVICVPVADLTGESLAKIFPNLSTDVAYNTIPVCANKKNNTSPCPRLHQLVYNDIIEIVKITDTEAQIKIPQAFYVIQSSTEPQTTYWTSRNNIRTFEELNKKGIDTNHIPVPINYAGNNDSNQKTTIITLSTPHYDKNTNLTFSAGTRFVSASPYKKWHKTITVYAINYDKNKKIRIKIPHQKCINSSILITPEERIKNYVLLLQQWAHQEKFIPYVWGGTTFINTMSGPFKEITQKNNNTEISWYEFESDRHQPKSGLDCSGAILRATHIWEIPYFYKNTTTIEQHLKPLSIGDTLTNGDLILVKGHVMVASDIQNNLLIEARGYNHGYGKLHEIEISKVFDGITTYQDLCNAFFNKKPLKRKDCNGIIRDTFNNWKILKMMSLFGAPDRI